ncbi:MAG: glycosyltransferase family 1 protein [Verrucomicrobia bacterium]|nr:MAG: glycosyltransferase family 1 protein [Verrucomicrobiota bacterium]
MTETQHPPDDLQTPVPRRGLFARLRSVIHRYRSARLIIIGYGFNAPGGAWRSIQHYHTFMASRGENVIRIPRRGRHSARQMFMAFLVGRRILFNGLDSFYHLEALLFCLLRRDVMLYLHETAYVFNEFKSTNPIRYRWVARLIRNRRICCVSRQHEKFIRETFGATRTHVVYENIIPPRPDTFDTSRPMILMVGTVEKRKGATLFSDLADLAREQGRDWNFCWVGPTHSTHDVRLSANVQWLGPRADVFPFLEKCALFFLSSVDDPFPLACLEALSLHRKCVVYRNTGLAEVLEDVDGCAVYESYDAHSALAAIDRALATPLDTEKVDHINKNISSVSSFAERMSAVLAAHDAER